MAEIVALLVIKVPSNTVTKKPTDYLNVDIDYEYRGPAQRVYFTAVVTQETFYNEFDEIGSTKKVVYVDLPSSDTLKPYTTRVPNLPLSGVEPKVTAYGVKIKAEGTFGTVEAGNKACLYVEEEVVEEYTLTITIDPPGGGTVAKLPDKTKYTYGESVKLTATPSSGYMFDHWSGDASGYSSSVTIAMIRDRSVTAHFKTAAPPPKVSFTVKGDGFPFLTSYWKLYHYDQEGNIWQDYTLHSPGDIIPVSNVQSAGKLSCNCCSAVTGEWSEQFYSVEFAAIDGEDYRYDIASGMVYYR